jgi:hypothetical protein
MKDVAHMLDEVDTGYQAYLEGRQAAREGKPIDVNPYAMGHESHEFCRGWGVEQTALNLLRSH